MYVTILFCLAWCAKVIGVIMWFFYGCQLWMNHEVASAEGEDEEIDDSLPKNPDSEEIEVIFCRAAPWLFVNRGCQPQNESEDIFKEAQWIFDQFPAIIEGNREVLLAVTATVGGAADGLPPELLTKPCTDMRDQASPLKMGDVPWPLLSEKTEENPAIDIKSTEFFVCEAVSSSEECLLYNQTPNCAESEKNQDSSLVQFKALKPAFNPVSEASLEMTKWCEEDDIQVSVPDEIYSSIPEEFGSVMPEVCPSTVGEMAHSSETERSPNQKRKRKNHKLKNPFRYLKRKNKKRRNSKEKHGQESDSVEEIPCREKKQKRSFLQRVVATIRPTRKETKKQKSKFESPVQKIPDVDIPGHESEDEKNISSNVSRAHNKSPELVMTRSEMGSPVERTTSYASSFTTSSSDEGPKIVNLLKNFKLNVKASGGLETISETGEDSGTAIRLALAPPPKFHGARFKHDKEIQVTSPVCVAQVRRGFQDSFANEENHSLDKISGQTDVHFDDTFAEHALVQDVGFDDSFTEHAFVQEADHLWQPAWTCVDLQGQPQADDDGKNETANHKAGTASTEEESSIPSAELKTNKEINRTTGKTEKKQRKFSLSSIFGILNTKTSS